MSFKTEKKRGRGRPRTVKVSDEVIEKLRPRKKRVTYSGLQTVMDTNDRDEVQRIPRHRAVLFASPYVF